MIGLKYVVAGAKGIGIYINSRQQKMLAEVANMAAILGFSSEADANNKPCKNGDSVFIIKDPDVRCSSCLLLVV